MKKLFLLLASGCVWAQSGLDLPALGQMVDGRGVLWPLYGVAGSFTVGVPQARGVVSSACSRQLCIAKTASAIVAEGVTVPAPRGPALIALDGANAWVYFPATRQLARWSAGALTPVVFHPDALHRDGEVLSLRADLTMAVRRGNTTWIVAANGALLDSLPDGAGPVLLIPGAAVYATGDSLMVRRDGGSEVRFPASGILSLSMLGDGLVEARAGSVLYALVTDSGSERLLQLPQAGGGSRR